MGASAVVSIEAGLGVLVAQLPEETRLVLALGPRPENARPYNCGVCTAMDVTIDRGDPQQVEIANIILDFHDADGSVGPECYRRCCAIYRAAGWTGDEPAL